MEQPDYLPQHSRLTAILLGIIGGAIDVYSHLQFGSLVATQTGNIILLISDVKDHSTESTLLRCLSILFFSVGFLVGVFVKDRAKTAFWRVYMLLPLLIMTAVLPLLPHFTYLWVILLAFGTGLLMLTFTGSKIEDHPYMILMTSGNYRKMLLAWYRVVSQKERDALMVRQAMNYSLTVLSFILGAMCVAFLNPLLHEKAIWSVTICLALVIWHYMSVTIRYGLQKTNL
ncbi:YoaK family protein [Streptococcus saliviloxodontae]|uniref:Uncharacterized membrane protein YoaK (UPF0700 family) n=1 Tax=Streptococcus saliviloxodontae TaxID=1349416 RepID=A0ABS2PP61_9STRE|nr:YoaK family protein [Streptococcus saliviloxodontae]MBM7637082.1 uncharacterized membrane protein YoaK (UPF0700 family) [Streptococcus saliviloxodontae]